MLVNVVAEEQGREEIFNKQRQVTFSLIFCFVLVGGLLYAVNKGYGGLQKHYAPNVEAPVVSPASQDQSLPKSATGTSRLTKDSERVGGRRSARSS
jgi:hypothetical protein